jgi:Holliday junction resolvase RusA-like endonuclease
MSNLWFPNSMIQSPYEVHIDVSAYQDIDNFIKPILDILQLGKVIDNDKNVNLLYVRKTPIKRGQLGKLEVFVGTL